MRSVGLLLLGLMAAGSLVAQDTTVVRRGGGRLDSRSPVARRGVNLFNAPGTTRFVGETTLTATMQVDGNAAFFDGPVVIAGAVFGDVVAINSSIVLEPGAEIRGEVLVIGGSLFGLDEALVTGNTRTHRQRALVQLDGERLTLLTDADTEVRRRPRRRSTFRRARSRFSVELGTGGTYNRVEGLPIFLGPRLSWGGSRRQPEFLIEGYGIVRTAGDLSDSREDLGYTITARLDPGARGHVVLEGQAFDRVRPIEAWQLHDDEVGVASFLWHRDYRDYFLERGISGSLSIMPTAIVELYGKIARAEETSIAARDPWTPWRGDDPWRANPAIDVGTFTSVGAGVVVIPRGFDRSSFFVRAEWERGISDDVAPRVLPAAVRSPIPTTERYTFDRLFVDLRSYQGIGRDGLLSLRAVGAGTVSDQPLPIQRRLSLGGPGALPGFPFRRFACNETVLDPAGPALCDRMVLFQVEYRSDAIFPGFGWNPGWSRHDDWQDWWDVDDWFWFDGPTLVVFGDAGTAWIDDDGPGRLEWNVGGGLEFGSVGFYAVKAIDGDEPLRIRLRLHHRF